MSDFQIIICTRNEEKRIGLVLECLKSENLLKQVIIVDGNSSDKTVEIVSNSGVKLLHDNGGGLAAARNIGLNFTNKPWVLYLGPDNLIKKESIQNAIIEARSNDWHGISLTSYYRGVTYLGKSYNISKRARFGPGEKLIIGTPWIYNAEVLKEFRFNSDVRFSDDTDLCARLTNSGYRLGVSQSESIEIGCPTIKDLTIRYKMYGISDSEFFRNHVRTTSSIIWRVKSLLHPFNTELIKVIKSKDVNFSQKLYSIPYCVFVSLIRAKSYYTNIFI